MRQRSRLGFRSYVSERLVPSIQAFVQTEASSGLLLLAAAVAALAWANSPWDATYKDFWSARLSLDLGSVSLHASPGQFVNDGLMAIFFFVVGLEIKRELLQGELASPRRAALPVAAAAGGMVLPALIYAGWNAGGEGARGWGVPVATDIAFALGALALLGRRVPFGLKVFVLALAIVDDLGAIAVIAIFYSESLSWGPLVGAVALAAAIFVGLRAGIRNAALYVALALLLWFAVLKSGVHPTGAGVVLAMLTPARPARAVSGHRGRSTGSPLVRLERALHPWVSYGIIPVFALANAGIPLAGGAVGEAVTSPVGAGIVTGLVIGKPAGIALGVWLALRLGIGALPEHVGMVHILGAGILCGIGFTVSLFVTGLAFDSPALLSEARIAVLVSSLVASAAGFVYLWIAPGEPEPTPA